VPPRAELEPGFSHWFSKLTTICKEAGLSAVFYAAPATLKELQEQSASTQSLSIEFKRFVHWEDFLILSRELRTNDLFVIVSSRKGHVSFDQYLNKLPYYLSTYFTAHSFLIVYPEQLEHGVKMGDIEHADSALMETITGNVGKIGKAAAYLKKIISRK